MIIRCIKCKKQFEQKRHERSCGSHRIIHQITTADLINTNCPHCDRVFYNKRGVITHINFKHPEFQVWQHHG